MKKNKKISAFTLVEILLVIGLLALLASITIIAINPAKQLTDSRDVQREADVYTIMQALYQYASDNEGIFPIEIASSSQEICVTNGEDCSELTDLSVLVTNQKYLVSIPVDPLCGGTPDVCSDNGSGYFVMINDNGRVQVSASSSENRVISVTQ